MTTNQTIDGVPRELLADLASYGESGKVPEPWMVERLRGLLDAPACEFHQSADECETYSGKHPRSTAAQPQGEPVAWQYRVSAGPQTGWSLWHDGKGEDFKQSYQVETRPLYAEQPAPVAVVMPERKARDGFGEFSPHSNGWNACLDELKRLNPSL